MSEPLTMTMAMLAGALLGGIFFGGLWWTVQRGLSSGQPALWFASSFILRTVAVSVGFYFAAGGEWKRLLSSLVGFTLARLVVNRWTRPRTARPLRATIEANHAP